MKTVVIFGGSGFVGQNIIRRIVNEDLRIIIPYQKPTKEAKLRLYGDVGQIIPMKFKQLNEDTIKNAINNADIVLNLKTIWQEKKGVSYEKYILHFNIQLVNLINKSNKKPIFIFFSGLGSNVQSPSKRVRFIAKVENYILENLNKSLIIRPGVIIGDNCQFLKKLVPIIKYFFFIPLFGSGKTKLQPVYVDDLAKAVEKILTKDFGYNAIYEIAGFEIFTYKSFYQFIIDSLGLKRKLVPIPFNLIRIVISIFEKTPFCLLTQDQLLLFNEDNIIDTKYNNLSNLEISPSDLRIVIKKILLNSF